MFFGQSAPQPQKRLVGYEGVPSLKKGLRMACEKAQFISRQLALPREKCEVS